MPHSIVVGSCLHAFFVVHRFLSCDSENVTQYESTIQECGIGDATRGDDQLAGTYLGPFYDVPVRRLTPL